MASLPEISLIKIRLRKLKTTLRAGFEPARGNPIGFQVQRLNHSAIATITRLGELRNLFNINVPICGIKKNTKATVIKNMKTML